MLLFSFISIQELLLVRHQLLDSLVLLQQKCSHNSSLYTPCAYSSAVYSGNGSLSLLGVGELSGGHTLDSTDGALAVRTFWCLGLLAEDLSYKTSTRCLNRYGTTGLCCVVSSDELNTFIRHG